MFLERQRFGNVVFLGFLIVGLGRFEFLIFGFLDYRKVIFEQCFGMKLILSNLLYGGLVLKDWFCGDFNDFLRCVFIWFVN